MKKIVALLLVLVLSFAGCGKDSSNDSELIFWSAPNVAQFDFWTKKAEEFNKSTDSGYTIKVQQMPETPSSEAGIQNAIATGEPPIASENVTRGFASQLEESGAIKSLNDFDQFSKIVEERDMSQTISSWEISGNDYVLPIYSVPMLMSWNTTALEANGVKEIPSTYDEALAAADSFEGSDMYVLNGSKYMIPDDWWEQWFFTLTYYESQSEGGLFYEDGSLVADEDSMIATLSFLDQMADKENGMFTSDAVDPFENKIVASTFIGGWQVPFWAESYPDLVYGENYELTPPLNAEGNGEFTFADSKGIVLYEGHEDEQYNVMMDFISSTLSDEGDSEWLSATGLTPARDDLLTNEMFKEYFEANPAIQPFAQYVPYAIPAMNSAKMVEIQTAMGKEIQTMITSDQSPEDTWKNIKSAIEDL